MKSTSTIRSIAPGFLALMLLAVPALSRADEPAKEKPLSKAKARFDADHDGKLNEAEAAAAKQAAIEKAKQTRQENLAKYDANHDGKLDDAERAKKKADAQAAKEARKAMRDAANEAPDDGDR